ncbi:MAG: TolC family protein [Candidatus Zixiibacteriota bacterium]
MGRRRRTMFIGAVAAVVLVAGVSTVSAEVLTLEQCIQIALERDGSQAYGLPLARAGYHEAGQGIWSAWGGLLPTLSHGYGYQYQKLPSTSIYDPTTGQFVGSAGGSSSAWSTNFSLNHELFDGGANAYRVALAYHNRAAQRERLRGTENALIFGVKSGYFGLLKADRLVAVEDAAVRRAEQFHKTIQSKYELGSASLSEVLKAKVQLGSVQLELLRRQNEVEKARAQLNTVLNRPVDEPLEIADVGDAEPDVPPYEEALARAMKAAPDVLAARASLRAAKDDVGIARATFFPTFSWGLTRSFTPERRDDLLKFDGRDGTWSARASLSFALFNAFHYKTALSNARVNLKYTRESVDQTERATALAVKEQHLGVQLASEARRLADETEASAQEDFNLAQEKYNLGAATILDLLDAQVSLTQAQTDKVNALFDYYVAVAGLENAMGGGQ